MRCSATTALGGADELVRIVANALQLMPPDLPVRARA